MNLTHIVGLLQIIAAIILLGVSIRTIYLAVREEKMRKEYLRSIQEHHDTFIRVMKEAAERYKSDMHEG